MKRILCLLLALCIFVGCTNAADAPSSEPESEPAPSSSSEAAEPEIPAKDEPQDGIPVSVLDERILVQLPETGYTAAELEVLKQMSNSSLSAAIDQTTFFHILELYAFSTGDLAYDAKYYTSQIPYSKMLQSDIQVQNGLEIIRTSYEYDDLIEGIYSYIVRSALIKMPDNTLIFAFVTVDYDNFEIRNDYIPIADSILDTLAFGENELDLSEREVTLGNSYTAFCPNGYAFSYICSQSGIYNYDFLKITAIDEPQAHMGIYEGRPPEPEPVSSQPSDRILGQEVIWDYSESKDTQPPVWRHANTVASADESHALYFFASYLTDEECEALQGIARSMQRI